MSRNGLGWLRLQTEALVVQAWRSTNFGEDDADSTLVLSFSDDDDGGRIDLVQIGVADRDYDGVRDGWEKYYWTPWRAYLADA